jgi:hypothetical protein
VEKQGFQQEKSGKVMTADYHETLFQVL